MNYLGLEPSQPQMPFVDGVSIVTSTVGRRPDLTRDRKPHGSMRNDNLKLRLGERLSPFDGRSVW